LTPAESLLWSAVKGNRLGGRHFRRQQIVHGFIVDFYCHAAGLVVELDGGVHRRSVVPDRARDAILESLGLRVLRIRNDEVERDIGSVLGKIAAACAHTHPPCPLPDAGRG
jgi:very-short-patch-repair endonuclease